MKILTNFKAKPSLKANWVDPNALKILQTLQGKKHTTYLVGGCVRDLLIGVEPKDYDIATNARPEEVRRHISHAYVIGRRFKLVLVKRGSNQYEVSTFRSNFAPADSFDEDIEDIEKIYGTPEQDAQRRDFTINGLFYDPYEEKVIDFTHGLDDIRERKIKMIGDPIIRIQEDSIRTLRALRLAHKINFSIDPELRSAMRETSELLKTAVLPRRREEILKILRVNNPLNALCEAYDLNILQNILPRMAEPFSSSEWLDNFSIQLDNGLNHAFDKNNPTLLFGVFAYAYLSAFNENFFENFRLDKDSADTEHLKLFFKDELGMFKLEQETFLQALSLLEYMRDTKISRLKPSQIQHVLKNNGFELALTLAHSYHLLHHSVIHDWWNRFKDHYGKKFS